MKAAAASDRVESVNQETQRNMRKGINQVATYKALMEDLHDHGIMVMGCFAADEDGKDVYQNGGKCVRKPN